jgi:hypothetical protein
MASGRVSGTEGYTEEAEALVNTRASGSMMFRQANV